MFEFESDPVDRLDVTTCADALVASVVEQRRVGAERLALVAHWADLHPAKERYRSGPPAEGLEEREVPGRVGIQHRPKDGRIPDRGLHLGGDGTPQVGEYTGVQLGALLETTTGSAERLIADALDLRHRLPRLWTAVLDGRVEDWKARKVASETRPLTAQQAQWVDVQVVEALIGLPFGRAMCVVEAKVIAADPAAHEVRRHDEAAKRYVAKSRRPNPAGLGTLVAQTTVGDIARIDAMIDHLATLMGRAGDGDAHQVRRTKAFALLANPALACLFLAHQHPAQPEQHLQPVEVCEPQDERQRLEEGEDPDRPLEVEASAVRATAVELGIVFGRLLAEGGTRVLDRLRPRTVLYVHLAEEALCPGSGEGTGAQVARVEGLGPVGLEQLAQWLGADRLTVKPVIDLAGVQAVDRYEAPGDLAEAMRLLHPFEVFPYGTAPTRVADLDHNVPYEDPDEGGPPGQTGPHNLGPLGRTHHRAKTFGGFVYHQPLPGLFLWKVPSGHWFRVDHTGTHPLGRQTPEILRHLDPAGHRGRRLSHLETGFGSRVVEYALGS